MSNVSELNAYRDDWNEVLHVNNGYAECQIFIDPHGTLEVVQVNSDGESLRSTIEPETASQLVRSLTAIINVK